MIILDPTVSAPQGIPANITVSTHDVFRLTHNVYRC